MMAYREKMGQSMLPSFVVYNTVWPSERKFLQGDASLSRSRDCVRARAVARLSLRVGIKSVFLGGYPLALGVLPCVNPTQAFLGSRRVSLSHSGSSSTSNDLEIPLKILKDLHKFSKICWDHN